MRKTGGAGSVQVRVKGSTDVLRGQQVRKVRIVVPGGDAGWTLISLSQVSTFKNSCA